MCIPFSTFRFSISIHHIFQTSHQYHPLYCCWGSMWIHFSTIKRIPLRKDIGHQAKQRIRSICQAIHGLDSRNCYCNLVLCKQSLVSRRDCSNRQNKFWYESILIFDENKFSFSCRQTSNYVCINSGVYIWYTCKHWHPVPCYESIFQILKRLCKQQNVLLSVQLSL